jgi:sortase A
MKSRNLRIFLAVAIVACGATIAAYPFMTDLRYAFAQRALAAAVPTSAASSHSGQPMPGGAVARIVIPKISLDAYVLNGTTSDVLDQAPGHYEETPKPGEHGNCCIAGHRTTYGHPFRHLDSLSAGDEIVTYTTARMAVYRVVSIHPVDPSEVGVAAPTRDNRLTLTTCNPVGSARERLVVVAALVR